MSVLFFTRFSCQQFRGERADRAAVGRILTLGLPTLVQMGSLSVVLVVMNGLLAPRAGTVGVAAFGYVSRLAEFALAPFSALCLAAAPIIGSSYGAVCIAGYAKRWCARCSWGWCMRWLLWQCVML